MSEDYTNTGRSRRRTAKRVDYAAEQEFSDEDLFEDAPEEKVVPDKPKRGRPKKTGRDSADVPEIYDGRPVYTEKGYDPSLPPIRDRFPFLPEYEADGSPKIELIVGRRAVDDKEDEPAEDGAEEGDGRAARKSSPSKAIPTEEAGRVEYEYLVKYKGRSYLHLEWKSGADLESMNKSAKGIYRRWLKKLANGTEEDLENPDFDPMFVVPERILDEADHEITVELTDKELLRLEKERAKEDGDGSNDEEEEEEEEEATNATKKEPKENDKMEVDPLKKSDPADDWPDEDIDYASLSVDKLREIVNRDGTYYPRIEGSNNPYRDGYATEPPKKPRPTYLFFQASMRSYFVARNSGASQNEIMSILGDAWRNLSDEDRIPFAELAREEAAQFEKEQVLLEKAQKPNEVWQPLRRCRMVLERLEQDSFADIFLEPVDVSDFPDYNDVIDSPMDLGTIRERLGTRHYQAPEQFARDMRRVWNNCKIYNQHGTAIWHVADYMSKMFERLYHAWVLEFRERYLRWADPRARPWENSCRVHDGKCKCKAEDLVLCDHCDGMYGFKCLRPPLKKIPTRAWHCPDCKPKLKSIKGARMLSALAENAARKRAELGDLPKKTVKQTMYLVKWKSLGYEFCTWETRDDINDEELFQQYQKENNTFPDEADLSDDVLVQHLAGVDHVNVENAGGSADVPELRAQLYAQTRSFHFAKFGLELPEKVASQCGPFLWSSLQNKGGAENDTHVEVVEKTGEMVFQAGRGEKGYSVKSHGDLPPPLSGEYDAIVPITAKGLMMNVGEVHGAVSFLGYRQFPDGSKGPAEINRLVHSSGDRIIAVDGIPTVNMSFKEVIDVLKTCSHNKKFAYMRFLDVKYSSIDGDITSAGAKGRYTYEELGRKYRLDRQRCIVTRVQEGHEDGEEEVAAASVQGSDKDSDEESEAGSEGEFEPDSDDEDLVVTGRTTEVADPSMAPVAGEASESKPEAATSASGLAPIPAPSSAERNSSTPMDMDKPEVEASSAPPAETDESAAVGPKGKTVRQEATRSLGLRLLDVDIGYSSDEGGDDECAYFIDGVDQTFLSMQDLVGGSKKKAPKKVEEAPLPARQSEFSTQGDRSKLVSVATLSQHPPSLEDFETFPYTKKGALAQPVKTESGATTDSPTKTKRSNVKVEQTDLNTGEIVHIWANAETAAANMQVNLQTMKQILRQEYDDDVMNDELGGFRWRYALAGAKVTAGNASTTKNKKAEKAWLEFRDKLYDPSEPHIYKNGNRLRDYQIDGVNWLASTWYKKQGCILADEMGLGKTVQIVCYIEHIYRVEKIRRPFLVVVPLSTIEHWRREFDGWTDMVCCVYHDRQRVWRDVLREYEWYYEDRPHTPDYLKFDVLVTTYDTLIGDFDVISQIPFRVAVVDEAHRLRNQKGRLLECMREISAKGNMVHGFQSRVLMSGTPLQNDLTELWTLLNFIEPFKFPDIEQFQTTFGNMANQQQVEALQQMISPFMLRRVKEDVAKDIPAKEETVIDVELTSIQKQYYRAIFEHNIAFLSKGLARNVAPKLMNIQMELRKVCNHPFLLEGVEHRETERKFKELQENGQLEGKSPEERQKMVNEHGYVMTSGKMVLLDKLLPKLRQEGHKVLIFSQFVKMLDLISEYCEFRKFRFERLDGRVRGTERQKAIDRFEREEDSFIFMLSTRAGGVGINLTAADICIIFDSDWNPQNDVQAQARCHRIGQTKEVRIYRLITSRSFEQEMFDRASKKLGLEQAVLGTFEKEQDDGKPSSKEMEQLLKNGAYALMEDDNDVITQDFVADDIDAILAKRTRTRVVEGAKTSSWLNKAGAMVTKSKFKSEKDTLDMDDPLFWQKVMPDFVTPSIMMQKLNDLSDDIEGVKRPGRGRRGRRSKAEMEADAVRKKEEEEKVQLEAPAEQEEKKEEQDPAIKPLLADESIEDYPEGEEEEVDEHGNIKLNLTRGQLKKVHKFMSDLKGMLESLLEDDEDLSAEEKDVCQKLLLTVSVKERIFNEDQRMQARIYLKGMEGGRRRRCRTSDANVRSRGGDDETATPVNEALMIRGKKKRKRRSKKDEGDGAEDAADEAIDEDGYKRHADDEGDWSDVGETIYEEKKKKETITSKEAKRRRDWGAGDDEATAAGRPWPVLPRHMVARVMGTLLEMVMKDDQDTGEGVFSVPVPKDEFPEYYDEISKPMDYGTMKDKLDNGEYRSAQSMQKDFVLILQNCRQFNDKSSDIVKEARRQHLIRPKFLKEAAFKHNLFLSENGEVLKIVDDAPKKKGKGSKKKKEDAGDEKSRKKKRDRDDDEDGGAAKVDDTPSVPKKKKQKKSKDSDAVANGDKATSKDDSPFMDVEMWKAFRKDLDGSFDSALALAASEGPWSLPASIPDDKFPDVAVLTTSYLAKHDKYGLFAEPVSDEQAEGYSDVVRNPMDFGTMTEKARAEKYGTGSSAAAALYEDFLLVFKNCCLYNSDGGDVLDEAARVLGFLNEAYATACVSVAKQS